MEASQRNTLANPSVKVGGKRITSRIFNNFISPAALTVGILTAAKA